MIGIQNAIQNEQVTLDQYMKYLEMGLEHDKLLLEHFEKIGDKAKAKLIKFRIECYEKEINEEVTEEE